jgi:hypothetical protein
MDARAEEKMSMSELFHMVSGTSTGSLLTTAIVLPNNDTATNATRKNMFFAVNATNIYKDGGKDVFRTFTLPMWVRILGTLVITAIGGGIGYCIGRCCFHNTEYEKTMAAFYTYIEEKQIKMKQGLSALP